MNSNSEARTTCTSKTHVISLPSRGKIIKRKGKKNHNNPPILFICVFEHRDYLNLLNIYGGRAQGGKVPSTNWCKMLQRCHCSRVSAWVAAWILLRTTESFSSCSLPHLHFNLLENSPKVNCEVEQLSQENYWAVTASKFSTSYHLLSHIVWDKSE